MTKLRIKDIISTTAGQILPTGPTTVTANNTFTNIKRSETDIHKRRKHIIPFSIEQTLPVTETDAETLSPNVENGYWLEELFETNPTIDNLGMEATVSYDLRFAVILEFGNLTDLGGHAPILSNEYRCQFTTSNQRSLNIINPSNTTYNTYAFRDYEGNVTDPLDVNIYRNPVHITPWGVRMSPDASPTEFATWNQSIPITTDVIDDIIKLTFLTGPTARRILLDIGFNRRIQLDPTYYTAGFLSKIKVVGCAHIFQTGPAIPDFVNTV